MLAHWLPSGIDSVTAHALYLVQSDGTTLPVSSTLPIQISRSVIVASASVTRPANTTAYVSGQLIANNTVAGSVVPLSLTVARINAASGMLRRVRLKVNDAAWAAAVVRAHFYKNQPTVSNGDGGVWLSTESEYLGYCDVTLSQTFSDPFVKGIAAPAFGQEINFDAATASQNIYALLECRSSVTPASGKTFTLTTEIHQA